MNGVAWDKITEIGSPWSDSALHTHQVEIGRLELEPGRRFLYLFDYGDNHEFDVTLREINVRTASGNYPKIVGSQGDAPQQYPDYDEETGEMSWNPYAHWGHRG